MASESAVTDHSSEEVEKEIKPEVKIMERVQVSPPKESVDSPEPKEAPVHVSTFPESGANVEDTKTEPIVTENVKRIDTDENPKAEESHVVGEESEQNRENKLVEVPPGEQEKKIGDASGDNNAEMEKALHPEPDVNSVLGESIVEKGEPKDKLDNKTVEKQDELKVEPSVEEKLGEPERTVEVSEQLPAKRAAREYIGNVEVLPDEEMEEPEAEKAGEKKDEEKVENVDQNPGGQVEAIKEREVKGTESKPGEISETEPAEKLEQSTVESVEEKPEEPSETVQVPLQSSSDPVEEKINLEELPDKEVRVIVEKEGTVSETEPAEKQEEFKVEPGDEKVDEPTKIAEHRSVEPIEEIVEKTLPAKEVKEVDSSETEIKPEEISESKSVESVEKIPDPVKIVNEPEQSSAWAKVEEMPAKDVETKVKEEVRLYESECKHKQDSVAEPSEKLEKSTIELPEEKPDKPKEILEAVEEEDKSIEKVEELPANIVEEIQEADDKEAKVSEVESKPEEISEKPVELEKVVDVPVQVTVLEKLGEAEELPAKEIETIKDREPQEIPETGQAEKLEESKVASVEEKPDESINILGVQELSSPETDKDKTEKGVELRTKEVEAISEKEIEVPEAEFRHEEISETEPAEKRDESKLVLVEENLDEPKKIADVPEQSVKDVVEEKVGSKEESPAKEVDATAEDAVKVSEDENKPEEINETKPIGTIEGQSFEPEKSVEVAEKPSVEAVEEKLEKVEDFPCKVVEAPVAKEAKVFEAEVKPEEISESTPKEKLIEQFEVTQQHETEPPAAEPLEKQMKVLESELKPEEIYQSTPEEKLVEQPEVTELREKETPAGEPSEKEAKVLEAELKPEEIVKSTPEEKLVEQSKVTDLHDKELPLAEHSEEEVKVLEDALKPDDISESTPEEKLMEQSEVTEQSEKEPPAAEPVEKESTVFEAELKPEEIPESTPKEKLVQQSEVTGQSEKEPPASEPVEQGKMKALAEKVDETELSNKDEPTTLETRIEELPEEADAPSEQEESVKKIMEIDPPPEEKVIDSGKTEAQEVKSATTQEFAPCEETKPTESEATEKLVKEEVTSRDIEQLPENGNTKKEAEVEGNGNEDATKGAEKCEPTTQIENIGRSLKEKLEQEKRDDVTTKTDVQTETTNESEDTKAAEDESKEEVPVKIAAEGESKEEVPVKTTQKQSHNIIKMVKQSLVKAKKAIIGKSANSKAPVSETKGDEVSK